MKHLYSRLEIRLLPYVFKSPTKHPKTSAIHTFDLKDVTGGVRLPPNVTKILYNWGYKQRLKEIAVTSTAIDIRLSQHLICRRVVPNIIVSVVGTGETLGRHVWEEELIRDARGNFMFTCVSHCLTSL